MCTNCAQIVTQRLRIIGKNYKFDKKTELCVKSNQYHWSFSCYTRRQIKNDQPGSHDFWRFIRQF